MTRKQSKTRGIALVTVLVATAIAGALLFMLNANILGELRTSRTVKVRNEMTQAADGLSEQARMKLLMTYRSSSQTVENFLQDQVGRSSAVVDLGNGLQGRWAVRNYQFSNNIDSADIHATVWRNSEEQTVVRRVSFGDRSLFNLALLAERTDCMFCHLQVNGDVGSLQHFRPGWGDEADNAAVPDTSVSCLGTWESNPCDTGWGSAGDAGGSRINGSLFGARTITDDYTDLSSSTRRVNGAQVTGRVEANYGGPELTQVARDNNSDGVPDFPPIERARVSANARGSLSGGQIIQVARGSTLTPTALSSGTGVSISRTYTGNAVLIGTAANPIRLDGNVFIDGDVVIKGVVTGRGAIYAGRNVYIAGDLTVQNPPDPPGQGVCSGITEPDACAVRNIQAGRDELRLAARNSTIVGDYRERDSAGVPLPADQRQSAEFYRTQFYFEGGQTFYYDPATGDELTRNSDGDYFTVEGQPFSGTPIARQASRSLANDAYDYSFRPGNFVSGAFVPWMSDQLYTENILGQQNYEYMTWRAREDILALQSGESAVNRRDRIRAELIAARIPSGSANVIACRQAGLSGSDGCPSDPPANGNILNDDGSVLGYYNLGNHLSVVIDQPRLFDRQVTRVDAFLYANRRIAGRTSMNPLALNGGMIGREVGILAPGRRAQSWMRDPRYDFLYDANRACGTPPYFVPNTQNCAFTINYDHRMRNGGFGFQLLNTQRGQTILWRLSSNASDRVAP